MVRNDSGAGRLFKVVALNCRYTHSFVALFHVRQELFSLSARQPGRNLPSSPSTILITREGPGMAAGMHNGKQLARSSRVQQGVWESSPAIVPFPPMNPVYSTPIS